MPDVNLQVSAGNDDADQSRDGSTYYSRTGGVLTIRRQTADSTINDAGARFQSVSIPQGAIIQTATMDLYLWNAGFDDVQCEIFGHDTDDAAEFASSAGTNDVVTRTQTSASVAWNDSALGAAGWKTTPDISSVVQEIVDRGGWASGNDLALIFSSDNGSNVSAIFYSYDGDSSKAPKLDVTYTVVPRYHQAYRQRRIV